MGLGETEFQELLDGNKRFASGTATPRSYSSSDLADLAKTQTPKAAVISCSDSRVAPEIIFDQPLGSLFVSRIPGNVAGDSTKWMLELAIMDFNVPLLVVVGHTGCLAVGQVLSGQIGGTGGSLRLMVLPAVNRARLSGMGDVWREAVVLNARQTIEQLERESAAFRQALASGSILARALIYDMASGRVEEL